MKIHVYLLCYNEENIIESVLRYYSKICSRIFLMDNHSTDNTLTIAKKFDKVTVISWKSSTGMIDEQKYVNLKSQTFKQYSRAGGEHTEEIADWVISCDMDEVLYHPDLINMLTRLKTKNVTCPETIGIEMVGENSLDSTASIVGQYKAGFHSVGHCKNIIFTSNFNICYNCLLYTSPSPRDQRGSRMPSCA